MARTKGSKNQTSAGKRGRPKGSKTKLQASSTEETSTPEVKSHGKRGRPKGAKNKSQTETKQASNTRLVGFEVKEIPFVMKITVEPQGEFVKKDNNQEVEQ